MKSKAILFIILCIIILPVSGKSQTVVTGTSTKTERTSRNRQVDVDKYMKNLDSVMTSSGYVIGRNADWNLDRGSFVQLLDNSRNSSLSFRKEFHEKQNIQRSYDMDFDKEQKVMDIRVSAEVTEGKIQIVIVKPNGKTFKTLDIEGMENLSWNESLKAYSDENKEDYSGTWQVKVIVSNALGYYNVRMTVR